MLAEKFATEGCNVAINYNASEDRAQQVAQKIRNTYDCKAILVKGVPAPSSDASSYQLTKPSQDQGVLAECENTVQESIDRLGGLDILVSNAVSLSIESRSAVAEDKSIGLDQNVHICQPGRLI